MASIVLLDLMGGVALLLWGLHMVQSGILRAFGSDLRYLLSKALGSRFAAFAAGLGLTALLQSSTATGIMTASFAAAGLVQLVPALAIMLGAKGLLACFLAGKILSKSRASGSRSPIKRSAITILNATWNSAVIFAISG